MPVNHPTNGPAGPGPGVDAQGLPVIDPTANVMALVEAMEQRLTGEIHQRDKRQNDLRHAEHRRVLDLAKLRAKYEWRIQQSESRRIDAIRDVDQDRLTIQGATNAQAALALAAQVAQTAEAQRSQVANLAVTVATSLSTTIDPIRKDIADLRQVQYENVGGKAAVVEQKSDNMTWIMAGIAFLTLLIAFVGTAGALIYYMSIRH